MTRRVAAVVLVLLAASAPSTRAGVAGRGAAGARPGWAAQAVLGGAANLPTSLALRQEGEENLDLQARYDTGALDFPVYYALRVARWRDGGALALELRHHKLYLRDPPPEVDEFAISHGYNLLTLFGLRRAGRRLGGFGAGVVIAHPENRVRGRPLPPGHGVFRSGYVLAGPTATAVLGAELPLGGTWYLPVEGALSVSWARVPIAGGSADVPNVALHATAGLGWRRR